LGRGLEPYLLLEAEPVSCRGWVSLRNLETNLTIMGYH
jgi:hypothetical protein